MSSGTYVSIGYSSEGYVSRETCPGVYPGLSVQGLCPGGICQGELCQGGISSGGISPGVSV